MNDFERAIGGMADIAHWFLWRLVWNATTGKYDKTPSAHDGSVYRIDASRPENWADYDTAQAALARLQECPRQVGLEYALGFWMTADCGYWFLDIDKCGDNAWAQQLVACYF